jgi:Family of unknown function (DUF5681)
MFSAMPFVKGKSGNPGGQQADKPFRDAIALELQEEIVLEGRELRKLRVIARALVNKATDGDLAAIKEVIDRIEGKPPQTVAGDNADGSIKFILRHIVEAMPAE